MVEERTPESIDNIATAILLMEQAGIITVQDGKYHVNHVKSIVAARLAGDYLESGSQAKDSAQRGVVQMLMTEVGPNAFSHIEDMVGAYKALLKNPTGFERLDQAHYERLGFVYTE